MVVETARISEVLLAEWRRAPPYPTLIHNAPTRYQNSMTQYEKVHAPMNSEIPMEILATRSG